MTVAINENGRLDVVGIGSALLDLIVEVDDAFLKDLGLTKGQMHLVDADRSREIQRRIAAMNIEMAPGGSAANTLAGLVTFGGSSLLLGCVGDDEHGATYVEETEKQGVETSLGRKSTMTGHAITFITPDSERTFATHLGAALAFSDMDVAAEDICMGKVLHLEGYLFEPDNLHFACTRAMKIARDNDLAISLDLSDAGLIGRIHDRFHAVLEEHVSIIFVNEDEASAYTGKEPEEALLELGEICECAVVKLGEKGSLIRFGGRTYSIQAEEAKVVNTNGAGDMFAAGILYGITHGYSMEEAGRLASYAAAKVVSQVQARLSDEIDPDEILDM